MTFFQKLDRSLPASDELGTWGDVKAYWAVYGGPTALIKSPALWLALAFTFVFEHLWITKGWSDITLSIVPNLLGFSLGAMAIVLAFPSGPLFKALAEDGNETSFYLDLSSKMIHFIFIQIIAIVIAVAGKSLGTHFLAFLGVWSLLYALFTAALTAIALFGVARLYNRNSSFF